MAPKREGVDALGLPYFPANRSRPGSSAAASRPGIYTLGGNISNSSSSLVIGRNAAAATSEPNLAAAQVSAYSGPVPAVDAPHLSTTEAFFGRMTLTAPDNMKKKKAEEKEKKKQARKRRAERGAAAAATLINTTDTIAGGSSNNHNLAISSAITNAIASTDTSSSRQRPRRPVLPTSSSASNLHLYTLEHSRSRSPVRPARPHSAQTNHSLSQQQQQIESSSSRRRQTNRGRSGSDLSNRSTPSSTHNVGNAAAPIYANAETSQQGLERSNTQIEDFVPSTAAQRRRDIYADLESLGLPGANESDLEDQPPPFPSYARRPISPPCMPAEGEEWTEEMRRRQENFEMNRPPDSPPPAFRSEDEQQQDGDEASHASSSEIESIVEEAITSIRKNWEDDILAGFTLEERIARDQERRFLRESSQLRSDTKVRQEIEPSLPILGTEGLIPSVVEEAPVPLNLGKLVTEARARRAKATERGGFQANSLEASGSDFHRIPAIMSETSRVEPHTGSIVSQVGPDLQTLENRQEDVVSASTSVQQPPRAKRRRNPPAAGVKPRASKEAERHTVKVNDSKPSPSIYMPSRFRDGASAAANRRMALWGPAVTDESQGATSMGQANAQMLPLDRSEGDLHAVLGSNADSSGVVSAQTRPRLDTSSSDANSNDEADGDAEISSDSDEAWNKEDAAFEAMQRRLAPRTVAIDSSDEEKEEGEEEAHLRYRLRSNSIDLARPGSSVPKAPPPLVLGRSRGGMDDYSSSSSSSSDSGIQRREDDSDDGSLSPLEGENQVNLIDADLNNASALIKGKKPLRPTLLDKNRSASAPEPILPETKLNIVRAGQFEEDSSSSQDCAIEKEADPQTTSLYLEPKPRQQSNESISKSPISNRLKGLFSASLDANIQQQHQQGRSVPISSRDAVDQSDRRSLQIAQIQEDVLEESSRDRERASLETKFQDYTIEQQARLDALDELSRLQQLKSDNSSFISTNIDQTSLDALERLLSRRSVQTVQTEGSFGPGLTRSGAIHRQDNIPAPFVNPRSSVAPKPLGRLPTITSDTRHFPPSTNSTIVSHDRKAPAYGNSSAPHEHLRRRNGIGTPSWMAYIPSSERAGLPDPIEPDIRSNINGIGASTGAKSRIPPPLPSRTSKSRVLAMVERFEGQTSPSTSTSAKPISPVNRRTSDDILPTEFERIQALRRRPPPPPPVSPPVSSDLLQSTQSSRSQDTVSFLPVSLSGANPTSDEIIAASSSTVATQIPLLPSLLPQSPIRRSNRLTTLASSSSPSHPRPLPIPPPLLKSLQSEQENTAAVSASSNADQEEAEPLATISPWQETPSSTEEASSIEVAPTRVSLREASLGFTDLDLFASRLADQAPVDGTDYDDLHLLAEFLGPAKSNGATAEEVEALSVGVVEVMRKRVVGKKDNGKEIVKLLLNVMGVKVERCGVCLVQFKEGNMACVFPCLHVLHEDCARKLLRSTKLCPTCRIPIAGPQ